MRIESSLQHFKGQAPDFLQGETLEGIDLNTNSFPIEELDLELLLYIPELEKVIFRTDENKEGALAMEDERLKQRSSTFPMSLAGH